MAVKQRFAHKIRAENFKIKVNKMNRKIFNVLVLSGIMCAIRRGGSV